MIAYEELRNMGEYVVPYVVIYAWIELNRFEML